MAYSYSTRLASFRETPGWKGPIPPADLARAGFSFAPTPGAPDNCRCFNCKVEISEWGVDDIPLEEHLHHSAGCEWARASGASNGNTESRLQTFKGWPHHIEISRSSPLALAQAGFYFTPSHKGDDTTSCAYCGACLDKWGPNDIPLEKHRFANTECEFVLRCLDASSSIDNSLVGNCRQDAPLDRWSGLIEPTETEGDYLMYVLNTMDLDGVCMVLGTEEESVNSTDSPDTGLTDPVTPSRNTPQQAPESERPAFSSFKLASTSTPLYSMSPTKMTWTSPRPSPLGAPSPIRHEENDTMLGPLASPLSCPRMQGSMTSPGYHQFMKYLDELRCFDAGQKYSKRDGKLTLHTADNGISTPSPACSSIDELIQSLPPAMPEESQVSDESEPTQLVSELSDLDISNIECSGPIRKEPSTRFDTSMPASSERASLQTKPQIIEEWQQLLADEVDRQILAMTENVVEQLELHRERILQEMKARSQR